MSLLLFTSLLSVGSSDRSLHPTPGVWGVPVPVLFGSLFFLSGYLCSLVGCLCSFSWSLCSPSLHLYLWRALPFALFGLCVLSPGTFVFREESIPLARCPVPLSVPLGFFQCLCSLRMSVVPWFFCSYTEYLCSLGDSVLDGRTSTPRSEGVIFIEDISTPLPTTHTLKGYHVSL